MCRKAYQTYYTLLGLPGQLILHVGDSLEADVEGAKRAGFGAWKIHRDTKSSDNKTLSSLAELPAKLAKFSTQDKPY